MYFCFPGSTTAIKYERYRFCVDADQSLAVKQGCAASIADGPVGEVEHVDDLMGQNTDVPLLAEQLHASLFGHTLHTENKEEEHYTLFIMMTHVIQVKIPCHQNKISQTLVCFDMHI